MASSQWFKTDVSKINEKKGRISHVNSYLLNDGVESVTTTVNLHQILWIEMFHRQTIETIKTISMKSDFNCVSLCLTLCVWIMLRSWTRCSTYKTRECTNMDWYFQAHWIQNDRILLCCVLRCVACVCPVCS